MVQLAITPQGKTDAEIASVKSTRPGSGTGLLAPDVGRAEPPEGIVVNSTARAAPPERRLPLGHLREALESLPFVGARQALFEERGRPDRAPHGLPAHHAGITEA